MSRIYTSKTNPGRARWELAVSPAGDVYAFPLTLAIADRHVLGGHSRYLVGHLLEHDGQWTATAAYGLILGTTFRRRSSALAAIADEAELQPVP
ncbi:MAG TPA: hypothetical protein VGI08_13175 [Diaminobutyricibacter sp.]|jgi:hypothetical protein|uniref:hypothetical protein n=1 Tax=Leifsonia sp. McL0618 TaxID=3415677 RepID=UPI003373F5A7